MIVVWWLLLAVGEPLVVLVVAALLRAVLRGVRDMPVERPGQPFWHYPKLSAPPLETLPVGDEWRQADIDRLNALWFAPTVPEPKTPPRKAMP